MATRVPFQAKCPSCGGSQIKTDKYYGNRLKRRELFRQVVRHPLFWIGFTLEVGAAVIFANPTTTGEAVACYGIALVGFALTVIASVQASRAVYGDQGATRYPEARFTCLTCGRQWTSEEMPANAEVIEPMQTEAGKSDASDTLEQASSAGSGVAEPKRQGTAVVIGALAGVAATLGPPFCMLTSLGGEMCSGYQVDVALYYGKLIPLALLAAAIGALFGRAIGRSRRPATSDAAQGQSPGCGIAAVAIVVGIGWMLVSLLVAIFPGC